MEDANVKITVKINTGKKKGKTVVIDTTVSDLELDDLASLVIHEGHLDCWCNNNEFTILDRKVTVCDTFVNLSNSANLNNPITFSPKISIMVAPQFCEKCNPSTWGDGMVMTQPEEQECSFCGHLQKFHIVKDDSK